MNFHKEFGLKFPNVDEEYRISIKVDNDDYIHLELSNKDGYKDENYYIKVSLTELKELNLYFKIFDSIIQCAETLSKIINEKTTRLAIDSENATIFIMLLVPGFDKNEVSITLNKKHDKLKEEIKKLKNKVDDLEIKNCQKDLIINKIQKNYEDLQKSFELFQLNTNNDFNFIKNMIYTYHENPNEMSLIIWKDCDKNILANKFRTIYPYKNVEYKLLYRKSRDSDNSSAFHSKCNNIRGTLVLIQTSDRLTFGGYTNATWDGANITKSDNTAFLFSLNYNKFYDIKKNSLAIFCSPNYGPYFCGNNNKPSLMVNDKSDINGGECCEKNNSNYNGFKDDYEINGGRKTFKILEIEVFKVNIV